MPGPNGRGPNGLWSRWPVAERAVRSHGVVMPPPLFDQYLGLPERVEYLAIQQLISELTVEALVVSVLPGTAGFDVQGLNTDTRQPLPDSNGGELTAIVGADVIRCSVFCEQVGENVQNIIVAYMPGNLDGHACPTELIDDGQHPERSAVMSSGLHEVIGPDMVRPARPETDTGAIVEP